MTQYRVSWNMWLHHWDKPYPTTNLQDDEAEARKQITGLLSMKAPHPPRKCGKHVWDVKLEVREVGEWKVKP